MRLPLVTLLRCPICGSTLECVDFDSSAPRHTSSLPSDTNAEADEIQTGVLVCPQCATWFPIINWVPVLLCFSTPLHETFTESHASALRVLEGFHAPLGVPRTGERSIQATFTEEWRDLGDDAQTFVYSDDELYFLHRDVWLQIDSSESLVTGPVLNAGVGRGRESRILSLIYPNEQIVAVDLNLELVAAGSELRHVDRLHAVIASIHDLPFAGDTFGHVHCQGVIHHTHSPRRAFMALAHVGRATKSTLFLWVYAREDAYVVDGPRGLAVRAYWTISHGVARPILSRLKPKSREIAVKAVARVMHPYLRRRHRAMTGRDWSIDNTVHGLRDVLTPRFAYQLGFNTVQSWFEEAGYDVKPQLAGLYQRRFKRRLLGIGLMGTR